MSLQVKRFHEYMRDHMQPGIMYHSVPWDYAGTDQAILAQLEAWQRDNAVDVVSITGPLSVKTGGTNGMAEGRALELTVLYRTKEPVGV